MSHDLLLKNATVIDPSQALEGSFDVAVDGDRITRLASTISEPAQRTLDLSGKILTPGWVDIHAHVYAGVTTWGMKADAVCLASGVTTVVDAGSPGWATVPGFKEYIADRSRTQILTFVHVSGIGLTYGPLGEMTDMRYAAPEQTAFTVQNWPDLCVGIKVRQGAHQVGDNGVEPLRQAVRTAQMCDRPVMVHLGAGVGLPEVLAELRPGDIATHCYQGHGDHLLGDGETIIDPVWEARKRGVIFDLGHGGGSFSFDIARKSLAQGFPSDVISTDLHSSSFERTVQHLPDTASKVLNLGVGLVDIVRQTTSNAATAIGREDNLGTLRPGTVADLAAFEIQEGNYTFADVHNQLQSGTQRIQPVLTVRAGKAYHPRDLNEEIENSRRQIRQLQAIRNARFES